MSSLAHAIATQPDVPVCAGEVRMQSSATITGGFEGSSSASSNDGGVPVDGLTPQHTPTAAFLPDMSHESRILAANKVLAKAWPLVDRSWYPEFHCAAYAGWMSVPGGLCYHNGCYHLFYQHHPFSENWGPMHWGHCASVDLVHWKHLPVALAPGEPFDHDGCFSGSAVSHDGKLYLFYTGHMWGSSTNVNSEGIYQQQCLAVSEDDGETFRKLGPIVRPPPEYIHFRDPKVWRQDGRWWMVLGARDVAKDVGQLLLYSSDSLEDWDESAFRIVSRAEDKNVFMWECPDFFPVASLTMRQGMLQSPQLAHEGSPLLHSTQSTFTTAGYGSASNVNSGIGSSYAEDPTGTSVNGGHHHNMGVEGVANPFKSSAHGQLRSGSNVSSSLVSTTSTTVCGSAAGALASSDFVLIYCPQGMSGQGTRYRNRFQSGYLTGHWGVHRGTNASGSLANKTASANGSAAGAGGGRLGSNTASNSNLLTVSGSSHHRAGGTDASAATMAVGGGGSHCARRDFEVTQHFKELDHGHDFYAPQTFVAPDGRRILIGWLDMWESPMPSKVHGWSGVLTVPRELTYDCATQKVTMSPVRELASLRVAAAEVPPQVLCENAQLPLVEDCTAFEVSITFNLDNSTGEKFGLWLGNGAEIYYDAQTSSIVVNRHYPAYMLSGYRSCELDTIQSGTLLHLHLFIDRSSIELFVNGGAVVMSSRVYPSDNDRALRVFTTNGVVDIVEGTVWQLESGAVSH